MTLDEMVFEQLKSALQKALFLETRSPKPINPSQDNEVGQAEAVDMFSLPE